MNSSFTQVNDPSAEPVQRLTRLRELAAQTQFPPFVAESNNHIHTIYSFSPYTPAGAAFRAREAGLSVVGSVDHDSIGAAAEMREATSLLGMGVVTGFEIRVFAHSPAELAAGLAPLAQRKLNNPDSAGIFYMTVQGVPARSRPQVAEFLAPVRAARLERTRKMAESACQILTEVGAPTFDFENDLVGISQYGRGGEVTERHLLAAMATALIQGFGKGTSLLDGLEKMGLKLTDKLRATLGDEANPHLMYDLLGVMKAEYLERFYIQPEHIANGGECYHAAQVVEFANSIGAIPAYAYLGDVAESPTGDKKAERFEDSFLDELFAYLDQTGFPAVTYMPPRNTPEQIDRIRKLAAQHGLLEISGVDINQPRQSFNCPELRRPELAHLNQATWALVAHEVLADHDPQLALFAPDNPLGTDLAAKVASYDKAAQELQNGTPVAQVASQLAG